MSQAQEQRRKESWETHGKEQFNPTFDRLNNLRMAVEQLPKGSSERAEMQKKYDTEYADAFEAYDKATSF
ncbi:hypothetical protein ACK1JC_06050 [Acinetobacter sp. TY2]|uniref:hypothetical protein n=1 Tax=Acinetobacter sp. TY2 TaxID=3387403 RepID=UPI0039176C64